MSGLTIVKLKLALEAVLSPVGLMVVAMAFGLVLYFRDRRSVWAPRLLATGTMLYLVFLFSPLTDLLVRNLELEYAPLLDARHLRDVSDVVVLSGWAERLPHVPITSTVSEQTMQNMVEGIRLYRQLPRSRLVVSGGVGAPHGLPVAYAMAEFARALGVPDTDIAVEPLSSNTFENLSEVRKLVGDRPFILVATAWDLPRAMAVARKLNMKAIAAPAGIWTLEHFPPKLGWRVTLTEVVQRFAEPSQRRLFYLQWAYHEYLGYVWYWVRGRV